MAIRMPKRTQHCTFCKNHGVNIPKKGHHCPHQNCNCLLCKLTKKAQVAMRHQQRVWRHQKQKLKSQKFDNEELAATPGEPKPSKSQACDKCRNHNILKMKRNHQCPFQSCKCDYCSLTFKRREIMKHQQRVRRSRITSQVESDGAPSAGEEPEEEEGDYVYYQEESKRNLGASHANEASFAYGESNCLTKQHASVPEVKFNDVEVNEASIASNSISLRSTPDIETENSNPYHVSSCSSESFQPQGFEELSARESPPPLIHMIGDRPSASHRFLRDNQSISPPPLNFVRPFFSTTRRTGDMSGAPSPVADKPALPALPFDSFKEEPKDDDIGNSSVMLFNRENSPSYRSFPFSSQPLERLTALNASLDPSFRLTSPLEELRIRNYRFLPQTFIDSSLRNMTHPSAPSLLTPPYYQPRHQLSERNQATNQPIRPLPLNYSQIRHQGSFGPNLWNHMFLPFNLGLHQNATEASLMRFQGIVASSRFAPFNSQYN